MASIPLSNTASVIMPDHDVAGRNRTGTRNRRNSGSLLQSRPLIETGGPCFAGTEPCSGALKPAAPQLTGAGGDELATLGATSELKLIAFTSERGGRGTAGTSKSVHIVITTRILADSLIDTPRQ